MSSALTTKAGPVLGPYGCLGEGAGDECLDGGDGCGRGVQGGDDLDEREHRDGVEEVQPQDAVRAAGGHAEPHDGDGRGVGRQDGLLVLDDLVEGGEDVGLGLGVLDDGLDDEVAVGEVVEAAGEDRPGQRVLGRDAVQFAALDGAFEGDGHPLAGGPGRGRVGFADDGVEACAGAHLGDARAHLAAADDTDPPDRGVRCGAHAVTPACWTRWRA